MSDDGSLGEDSNLTYFSKIICEASANYNRPIPHHHKYFGWFQEAGFVDVKQIFLKSPTNPWPSESFPPLTSQFTVLGVLESGSKTPVSVYNRRATIYPSLKSNTDLVNLARGQEIEGGRRIPTACAY